MYLRSNAQRPCLRTALLAGAAGFSALALPVAALAQGAAAEGEAEQVEEVVVTGSRIRGIDAVGSNVVSLNREAITQSRVQIPNALYRQKS